MAGSSLSKRLRRLSAPLGVLALVAVLLPATVAVADNHDDIVGNEVLASHTETDDTEYIELYGPPGASLDGLSIVVVEGDAFDPGVIDRRFDFKPFHRIGANGFFLYGNCSGLAENYEEVPDASFGNNYLENSSLTVGLVETSSIDGDTVTGSEVALSALGLDDGDEGDQFYFNATVIGPDGPFFPAGGRRVADGVETGNVSDWVFADFYLGLDNTPTGGGLDGCQPLELTIPEIQGEGRFSVYEGEIVTTVGVVTAVTSDGRDMWIQDPAGDDNPSTSDGIFVDDANLLDPEPKVGDLVRLTGQVEEQQFGNALPLTRIDDPDDYDYEVLEMGTPLPAPVVLTDLPNEDMPAGEGFWEPLEGMLVTLRNAPVIAPTSRFGEFGVLAKADARPGSGFFPQTQQILVRSLGGDDVDYNPERIVVDDSTVEDPIIVTPGDRVRSLVGVVDYTFGMYKLQPVEYDIRTQSQPRGTVSTRSGGKGDFAITTYNVENLFDLLDNPDKDDGGSTPTPEELETQLTKLASSIVDEVRLPEILVLQEVENQEIAQELGDRVNDAAGTKYIATSFETSDGRGIEVAFLWDADRVSLVEAYQFDDTVAPGTSMWFGPGSPSPGREPLYGLFSVDGLEINIVGNHFKSKGGDDPLYGVNWPPIRVTETQRKGQAETVRGFVDDLLDDDPQALVMVTGDLNDFAFSEPGEGPDNPIAILEGMDGRIRLTNLIALEKPAERFSFVFDANSQVLDHMLVSPALLERTVAADFLHFNAGYPSALGSDATTSLRAADHDPLEGRFSGK